MNRGTQKDQGQAEEHSLSMLGTAASPNIRPLSSQ